jgi:adenylate cyclase
MRLNVQRLIAALDQVGADSADDHDKRLQKALLHYFVGQKNRFYELLRVEQQKSESLLLNVLPEEIATQLKAGRQTIADQVEAVSVLCADLVGFTPLSTLLSPTQMVELLNDIFLQFDALAEQYNVEKIRTIGDSYMVAAGVPRSRPDHAQALARMALDMSRHIQSRPPYAGHTIDFRIGINSGPAVVGVIGRKKFQYDLWGDTVNTASRMESHGTGAGFRLHATRTNWSRMNSSVSAGAW